jgi:hypothetical protein
MFDNGHAKVGEVPRFSEQIVERDVLTDSEHAIVCEELSVCESSLDIEILTRSEHTYMP